MNNLIQLGPEFHQQNMANFSMVLNAVQAVNAPPDTGVTPTNSSQVTADTMRRWNKLIAFAKDKGYAGKAELDHNPDLRQKVFDEYNAANPKDTIDISIVLPVQNEIQKFKSVAQRNIKEGKAVFTGKPEDFMKNISQVDNIFGQLTSQFSFPSAYVQDRITGEKQLKGFAPKVDISQLAQSK